MSELDDLPLTRPPGRGYDKGSKPSKAWCAPNWQMTGLFWIVLIGTGAFLGLVIAVVAKGDQLEQTSRATVSMHQETTDMRTKAEEAYKNFRAKFPSNQEEVTVGQILDSISKGHELVTWVDSVSKGIDPETIQGVAKSLNAFMSNATTLMEIFGMVMRKPSMKRGGDANGVLSDEVGNFLRTAGTLVQKGVDLINSVSPGEFHEAFVHGQTVLKHVSQLSQEIDAQRVSKIVTSVSDVLGAAESEHIVTTISKLVKGSSEVIRRFSQPGGLTLSLPLEAPAPAQAPQMIKK